MEDTKTTPIMFDHCVAIWEKMNAEADVDESGTLVYEGHLTKLFQSLNMPAPYYTSVMRHLKDMGCVEHVRRGGGNALSVWKVITPPTVNSFESLIAFKRPKNDRVSILEQRLRDLNERVNNLERIRV